MRCGVEVKVYEVSWLFDSLLEHERYVNVPSLVAMTIEQHAITATGAQGPAHLRGSGSRSWVAAARPTTYDALEMDILEITFWSLHYTIILNTMRVANWSLLSRVFCVVRYDTSSN